MSDPTEQSMRDIARRKQQQEFIARGLASREQARQCGDYVDADLVIAQLSQKLADAKIRKRK